MARDLHDSVTQSLYSLSLFARSGRDAAEEGDTERLITSLSRLEGTALQALREMRLLLYELRPEVLEQEGLIRTLEQRFDAVERRAGMKATIIYQAEGEPGTAPGPGKRALLPGHGSLEQHAQARRSLGGDGAAMAKRFQGRSGGRR